MFEYQPRKVKDGFDIKPTRTRLVRVAAALSVIAIAAPLSTAGAATAAPVAGQRATITGPIYITSAPSTFINNNNQVSSGNNSLGSQSAP